jgi:hypothetical protein
LTRSPTYASLLRRVTVLAPWLAAAGLGACDTKNVTPNRPPSTPDIASPASGEAFPVGAAIQFQGSSTDPEDGALSGVRLVWSSNHDGQIGTGNALTRDDLSEGAHTITLRATDSDGESSSASVSISVETQPPETPTITSPADDATFSFGEEITFTGSATDPEDGALTGESLVWTSSLDDEIGTGGTFARSDLSAGEHTITLTATDSDGMTSNASVSITVENQPPATPAITSPTDGSDHVAGAAVAFAGTAADPEDGPLTGASLVWTSDVDGEIGQGTSFDRADLAIGDHVITLTATDAAGASSSASVSISILGAPVVTIDAPTTGSTFGTGQSITFTGSAEDPEDGALTGASLVWTSDVDGQIGTGLSFTTNSLTVGPHTITLTATDSEALTGSASIEITIQLTASPVATIAAPTNGATFPVGANVTFTGSANDAEDGPLTGASLVWTSSLDGQIGTGASFATASLSAGMHTITLTATDSGNQTGMASISITIGSPPTATITGPSGGSTFGAGSSVSFTGTGTDPEDGALTGPSLVWTSSRDGQIGTGASFSTTALTVGAHTITLTVTDSDGLTDADQISITVTPPGSPPTIEITDPVDGVTALLGASVSFTATATDTEDGNLSGGSLVWRSSRDGQIGTGLSFSVTTLTLGEHTITLTATDSDGWVVTDTITLTIQAPPTATITQPADGTTVTLGSVTFIGSASDPEDGALTGTSLVWTSDVDGEFGTGVSVANPALTPGAHTITLTATDSDGLTDDASIDVTVNTAPTATITAPANNSSFEQGVQVDFTGTGSDPEDGALAGPALVWTSNRDGQIGTGVAVSTTTLTVGAHTITLTATDSEGATDLDQITVTITAPAGDPIVVQVGSTASSSVANGADTTIPIIVDMTNAAGRDVAALNLTIRWTSGVATYQSATLAAGSGLGSVNDGSAGSGELILGWVDTTGKTGTFTAWNIVFRGASVGSTSITVEVTTIRDENAVSLAADTGTIDHTLTVN